MHPYACETSALGWRSKPLPLPRASGTFLSRPVIAAQRGDELLLGVRQRQMGSAVARPRAHRSTQAICKCECFIYFSKIFLHSASFYFSELLIFTFRHFQTKAAPNGFLLTTLCLSRYFEESCCLSSNKPMWLQPVNQPPTRLSDVLAMGLISASALALRTHDVQCSSCSVSCWKKGGG